MSTDVKVLLGEEILDRPPLDAARRSERPHSMSCTARDSTLIKSRAARVATL